MQMPDNNPLTIHNRIDRDIINPLEPPAAFTPFHDHSARRLHDPERIN